MGGALAACGTGEEAGEAASAGAPASSRVYSLDDAVGIGWKDKDAFTTEFPHATEARWGFYQGREVAFFVYETPEMASEHGTQAALEQTEVVPTDDYKIFGPKVERTECRGFGHYSTPYRLDIDGLFADAPGGHAGLNSGGLGGRPLLLVRGFESGGAAEPVGGRGLAARECPRRAPLYTEFVIEGNLVVLAEPLKTEARDDVLGVLRQVVSSLRSG